MKKTLKNRKSEKFSDHEAALDMFDAMKESLASKTGGFHPMQAFGFGQALLFCGVISEQDWEDFVSLLT